MGRGLACAVAFGAIGLLVPAVAASAVESTPASTPTDTVVTIHDPTFDSSPKILLSGDILVTVSEPPAAIPGDPASFGAPVNNYSVDTLGGDLVPISGGLPAGVRSGDRFAGSVAVPQPVVHAVGQATAKKLATTAGHGALAQSTVASQEIIAAASDGAVPLPIVRAQVTTSPGTVATVSKNHEIGVVVENPADVAPLPADYTDTKIFSVVNSAESFWARVSNGRISQFATAGSIVRHSPSGGCPTDPRALWDDAALQLGYSGWQTYLAAAPAGVVRHLVVLLPPACSGASSAGVGTVGSDLNSGGALSVILGLSVDTVSLAHELGHNLSLEHSNLDYCDSNAATAGCTVYEYGDLYDVMGVSVQGYDTITALNSRSQIALGFVAAPTAMTLASGSFGSVERFTLSTLDGSSGTRFIDITDPISGQLYYLEYRGGEGGAPYYSRGYLTPIPGSSNLDSLNQFGVRMLRTDAGNGSAVISNVTTGGVRTSAEAGQSIHNPSGSVTVAVSGAARDGTAEITVTLSREAPVASSAAPQPVYRFWSPTNQTHFYTINSAERDQILATYPARIWSYEGVAYQAFANQAPGTVPLYRFWSPRLQGHFYTASQPERDSILASYPSSTWSYEGVAYWVYPLDTPVANVLSVARFWSPDHQHHFYTASPGERDSVISGYPTNVWTYEGARFFVPAT